MAGLNTYCMTDAVGERSPPVALPSTSVIIIPLVCLGEESSGRREKNQRTQDDFLIREDRYDKLHLHCTSQLDIISSGSYDIRLSLLVCVPRQHIL